MTTLISKVKSVVSEQVESINRLASISWTRKGWRCL